MFRILLLFFLFCASNAPAESVLTSKIPHQIWQTYKTKTLPMPAIEAQQTWIHLNPDFSCFLFDDQDIECYIQQTWHPDFLELFHALPIGAMKADLWRYLILASEGGVYSDLDSLCLQPIREWPINGRTSSNPHLLLIDLDAEQSQFCQWTLASTRRHPAMVYVCNYILRKWKQQGIPLNSDGSINVLSATGPAIFSDAIKSYIKESQDLPAFKILKKYLKDKDYRKRLNQLGIFFTAKGFFSGGGTKNLFWGSSQCLGDEYNSWARESKEFRNEP